MSKSSRMFLEIREDAFITLNDEDRKRFNILKIEPDDEDLFAGDEDYARLIRDYKKASKALRDYKFNKRHK